MTADKDFGNLICHDRLNSHGVVLIGFAFAVTNLAARGRMAVIDWHERISINPNIGHGKACIRGREAITHSVRLPSLKLWCLHLSEALLLWRKTEEVVCSRALKVYIGMVRLN